jgi:flagellar protein FlaG
MSAETFTSAMFLITAVLAAGVLINAIFPVVYTMAGTFNSATHDSDQRMRTDFKIITTFAVDGNPGTATIWMKNVGSYRVPLPEIERSDVFCGAVGNFDRLKYNDQNPGDGDWYADFSQGDYDLNRNGYWDTGETIKVVALTNNIPASGDMVYFQYALPNGVWRSTEFTVR